MSKPSVVGVRIVALASALLLGACSGGSSGSSSSGSTGRSTSSGSTSGSSTGGSSSGGTTGGGSHATVNLTFTGCTPDFAANVIVVLAQGSIAIERSDRGINSGQLMVSLTTTSGTITLSTQEASNTGDRIAVYAPEGVFQNSSVDATDPISGTLTVNHFDPSTGVEDLAFHNVVLEVSGGPTTCTINGTLVTTGSP